MGFSRNRTRNERRRNRSFSYQGNKTHRLAFINSFVRLSLWVQAKVCCRVTIKKKLNRLILFWGTKPSSKTWIVLPIGYMLILQVLTGLPKPESLRDFDSHELIVRLSEQLFDYPFWLQDLSHLPLFCGLAWLWSWFLGPPCSLSSALTNKALLLSLGYGIFNELIQAFIPQRFPSMGDLVMNSLGVTVGVYLHSFLSKTAQKKAAASPV
ncbi:MAG: hypothetical protein CMI29_03835 [Opitutae bacterium]|nr:hypothetical protein [Opitutae bacterium]